jgi:ubiquinone/menaquinone biosynthesis C-methylase UbiE
MAQHSLNYDLIANEYNQRYPASQHWERGRALLDLSQRFKHGTFLEVGSGTGFWLNLLSQVTSNLFGFDYSFGMIRQAREQPARLKLSRGSAIQLPYANNTFDLVYTVDAIHHFGDHRAYVAEAFRVLKPGGALVTIGHDPHEGTTNWYIYEYFDGVYDTDLRRYPSSKWLLAMMYAQGIRRAYSQPVEHIRNVHIGDSVLRDPFLKQNASSQLALLKDEAYQAGLEKIAQTIAQASRSNEKAVFTSYIQVNMVAGFKPIS